MNPRSPIRRPVLAAVLALPAVMFAACSSGSKSATPPTKADIGSPTSITAAVTVAGSTTAPSGPADGRIAGQPFRVGSQFVQYERMGAAWRLHLLDGQRTCQDELASLTPAVGVDFPAAQPTDLPATGPVRGRGVTFIQPAASNNGPLTTSSGVTLTLDAVDGTEGGHWTGHLTVDSFSDQLGVYSIDVKIDATVCPPTDTP